MTRLALLLCLAGCGPEMFATVETHGGRVGFCEPGNSAAVLFGSCSPGAVVRINGEPGVACVDGQWAARVSFGDNPCVIVTAEFGDELISLPVAAVCPVDASATVDELALLPGASRVACSTNASVGR